MSKTIDDLHEELLNNISDTYQKTEGFPVWDILRAFSYGLLSLWNKAFKIEAELDVDNLTGEDLERFINQRKGVTRKSSVKATGTLTVVSGSGTIKSGDLFTTESGIRFTATETKAVSEGDTVTIEAVEAGTDGNVPANTITEILVTIAGIVEVTNPAITEGGVDEETDDSLRTRYYEELRIPATSGNKYHYRKWAKEISGVGDAEVFSLWAGDNTVLVCIINEDGEPASSTLVNTVQEYIDPNSAGTGEGQAPIGAYCTVQSAEALDINVTATLTINKSYDADTVQDTIKTAIDNYCKSIGFNADYVSVAKIGDIILNVQGVEDYGNLLVNNSTSKITIPDKYVPVLNTVVFTIE